MTTTSIRIARATPAEAPTIVALVARLLAELGGFVAFDVDAATTLGAELLATDRFTALLAYDESRGQGNTAVGVLTLQACAALYVAGTVGWIQELYVAPEVRSLGVGHLLLARAVAEGHDRGWRRLEVNSPEIAAWPRTVAFYQREGFAGGSAHLRLLLA